MIFTAIKEHGKTDLPSNSQAHESKELDLLGLRFKNTQAEKLNPEQIVDKFTVHKTCRMTFRQVSAKASSLTDVSHCAEAPMHPLLVS